MVIVIHRDDHAEEALISGMFFSPPSTEASIRPPPLSRQHRPENFGIQLPVIRQSQGQKHRQNRGFCSEPQ